MKPGTRVMLIDISLFLPEAFLLSSIFVLVFLRFVYRLNGLGTATSLDFLGEGITIFGVGILSYDLSVFDPFDDIVPECIIYGGLFELSPDLFVSSSVDP